VSSYICPNAHTSSDADYCDVCGEPIRSGVAAASAVASAVPVAPPDPGPAATADPAATRECPSCGSENAVDALFCEDCGYDFTTGQAPVPQPAPSPLDLGLPFGARAGDGTGAPATDPAPSPGDPAEATDQAVPVAAPDPAGATGPAAGGPVPPPIRGGATWVAEVWVDPQWYAAQDATDPCPSPGMPTVVALRERSILIGRPSASRNIHPQIDLTPDTGVSRRHAQLTTDGQRWWVEDLQSANGTYVGSVNAELPSNPVKPGLRTELDEDARLYLGAWTRIVLRPATTEETSAGVV
jgi:FHA domain-containing protein/double zinc ribbon protein